jgi:hypothetical protein
MVSEKDVVRTPRPPNFVYVTTTPAGVDACTTNVYQSLVTNYALWHLGQKYVDRCCVPCLRISILVKQRMHGSPDRL